jgi:hypothetical protein
MSPSKQSIVVFSICSISLLAMGCGSGTATVSGTVTSLGKPVKNGSVILYCPDKQIVRGLIVDGKYSIPNVPCGSATVTVQAHARVPAGLNLQQQLPRNSSNRPLNQIGAGEMQLVDIPPRYALPEESGLVIEVNKSNVTYEIELKP